MYNQKNKLFKCVIFFSHLWRIALIVLCLLCLLYVFKISFSESLLKISISLLMLTPMILRFLDEHYSKKMPKEYSMFKQESAVSYIEYLITPWIKFQNQQERKFLEIKTDKYLKCNNHSAAIRSLTTLIRMLPDNPDYRLLRIKLYIKEMDYDNAFLDYKKLLEINYTREKLDQIKKDLDTLKTKKINQQIEENIIKAEEFYKNNNFNDAYNFYSKIPKTSPYYNQIKEHFKKCKKHFEQDTYLKNTMKAEELYQKSLQDLSNGDFESASQNIKLALKVFPDNIIYKEILDKANKQVIDILTCNKNAILSLGCFDEEKAEQFMKDRKLVHWYDLESFCKYFNLQPHEQIMLEGRLTFPLKPQLKKGRAIDI